MNGIALITGAGGFAGSHLVEYLAPRCDVVAWSRSAPPAGLERLAEWQHVELLDREQVRRALRSVRPTWVYHCAGSPHVARSWQHTAEPLAANVLATHHLLDGLCRLGRSCRVLVPSSAAVYAPSHEPIDEDGTLAPASPYALSKLAQEQLAVRAAPLDGVEVVIARSFNHTGPRQTPEFVAPAIARQIALIERGRLEPVIRVGNLEAVRDLTDVRDVVRAYAALMAAARPSTIYNVASGVGYRIRSLVDALVGRARVRVRIETDPARLRPADIPILVGDPAKLRRTTGWVPEIPFDRMLDDLLDYWRGSAE